MPDTHAPDGDNLTRWLEELSQAVAISGHEQELARWVAERLGSWCDEVRQDPLGNVIGVRRARPWKDAPCPPRVMLAAHLDEVGLVVSRIERGGFLRVLPVGGVNPQVLMGLVVQVHTREGALPGVVGFLPPHLLSREEMGRFPRWDDLFVDTGLPEEQVRARVGVGDLVSVRPCSLRLLGGRLAGKALDNRAGVAVLLECMSRLARMGHAAEVYAVATVQEEVGLRGAVTGTFGVVPDVGVAVDVTFARQRGVGESEAPAELGRGPVVARGANMHPKVTQRLLEVARAHGVPHQVEVIPGRSGTDAWAMQVSRSGVATGLVSVPLRYMHSPVEVVDVEDVRQAGRLLAHFCAELDAEFARSLLDWGVGA
ncbi:MAG TPA: hypothetical protein VIL11_00435 [Limnochordales bacterium]